MAQRYQGGVLGVGFNPLQAPNAPTIGAATAGNQQVSVAFTAPSNVGGSAISSYRVLVNPGGIGATTSSSPVTVSGLTNGTAYTFSVAAVNSYGFSPYSGTVTATPAPTYVEDVFSTWLYTGTGSPQTITNRINLSGQGGMVWIKARTIAYAANITDTIRGAGNVLIPSGTNQQISSTFGASAFSSTGFTTGTNAGSSGSGENFASWTFAESPKFFDVVTWTGDGVAGRTISHNLGVAPGVIMVKAYTGPNSDTENWRVYHRSTGNGQSLYLNTTDAALATSVWNSTSPTSTNFTVSGSPAVNGSGNTYVAYLFAHDAASDGIIQCGSYTGTGAAGNNVALGWEPQWVMIRNTGGGDWQMYDTMRGMVNNSSGGDFALVANSSTDEASYNGSTGIASVAPTATGFVLESNGANYNTNGNTYIYIAIRRGPMRTPTLGTSVFSPVYRSGNSTNNTSITASFAPDLTITKAVDGTYGTYWINWVDKLRGVLRGIFSNNTNVEQSVPGGLTAFSNTGIVVGTDANYNGTGSNYINYMFQRAPSFFDEVCFTTNINGQATVNHNLGVAPELVITKARGGNSDWITLYAPGSGAILYLNLNLEAGGSTPATYFSQTGSAYNPPSSTTMWTNNFNGNTTYVAYLFASCPGVSKVGSYTGNGSSQTINCGFTTGARFFLVKRTDSTGNWWVWDSARGITAPADPAIAFNSSDPQVTSADAVDPNSSGIIVNQEGTTNINVNGASYIFLAIS